MCVFQVCLLSKVIPRYVTLSVCCSSVSSNIIVTGFDLVDKVKSVLKDLVLLIFTHQSCAQLDNMLVASWCRTLAVVAYYSVLHRTKSSAYIAHFTGDGNFLIRSLMNTKKNVGDMTPPCGTPCLRSIFLLFVLSMTTLVRRVDMICSSQTYFQRCCISLVLEVGHQSKLYQMLSVDRSIQ